LNVAVNPQKTCGERIVRVKAIIKKFLRHLRDNLWRLAAG